MPTKHSHKFYIANGIAKADCKTLIKAGKEYMKQKKEQKMKKKLSKKKVKTENQTEEMKEYRVGITPIPASSELIITAYSEQDAIDKVKQVLKVGVDIEEINADDVWEMKPISYNNY